MGFASVRVRLALWNVGVLALLLLVLGVGLRYAVRSSLVGSVERSLRQGAERFIDRWSREAAVTGPILPPWSLSRPSGERGGPSRRPFRVLDRHSCAIFTGEPQLPVDPAAYRRALAGKQSLTTTLWDGAPTRVLSVPIYRGGRVAGVVQEGQSLADVHREVDRLTRTLLAMLPVALFAAALAGVFLTDRALRPVRRITHAAARIGAADLSGRLPVRGRDEFAELAATFNGMLARLEAAFLHLETALEQQRRFTADASHELRTPLTIARANTSLALRGERTPEEYRAAIATVDRAIERTHRIVQDLLLLARADAGQLVPERTPTPLLPVLEEAIGMVRGVERAAPGSGPGGRSIGSARLIIEDPALAVLGDSHHLTRLFTNLLQNAARHTPADGRITLAACADGEEVVVRVEDTGEGIPPEHLARLGERFYRVDAARTRQQGGTGLGLAICRSIVEGHRGALAIESELGSGTTVTVRLPRAASWEGDQAELEGASPKSGTGSSSPPRSADSCATMPGTT